MPTKLFSSIILLLIIGWSSFSSAHKYFFGLTELSVNPRTQSIEVIHQFTAHDIEYAIAESTQEHFSPGHEKYEIYIQSYVEEKFKLSRSGQEITLNWIGLELVKGNIYIYQEVPSQHFLQGIVVKNALLVDTNSKQVNTLNYQDAKVEGSLTFTHAEVIAKINNNK